MGENLAKSVDNWCSPDVPLCQLEVKDKGKIEDSPGALQVDFANEYIGGGVLGCGQVQVSV